MKAPSVAARFLREEKDAKRKNRARTPFTAFFSFPHFASAVEKFLIRQRKCRRYVLQLNVGHESLAAFDALNRIFVDVESDELKPVRQLPLRNAYGYPLFGDFPAANIVTSVGCLVDKHIFLPN